MNQFIKVSSFACVIGASIMLIGCSDDADKKETTKKTQLATSKGIEVVANTNANEIKVAQKKTDTSQDKSYYLDYGVKAGYKNNAQPANKDASVRVKPRTKIDANLHVRSPYENVELSMMVNKLSKEFIVKCSACHSDYANGVIGPSLLGKSAEYIYEKIQKFKHDKSLNVLMSALVSQMSDAQIQEMANEIYRFNLEINKMRNR